MTVPAFDARQLRWLRLIAFAAALGFAFLLATSAPARAAESTCPATFHVLHDDHVGKLKLPEGHYRITLLDDEKLTCQRASDLFRRFLEDVDGKLPGRWRVAPARSEFVRGRPGVGFRVTRVGSPSGGGSGGRHPASGQRCPFTFHVLHHDHIGKLNLPRGRYRITVLHSGPTCARASSLFTRFLQDWDGKLPAPWRLHVATATFFRTPSFGFRVKRAGGKPHGGGHRHPSKGARRCRGPFRVLHNDRIGKLRLPAGRYRITVTRPEKVGCPKASRLFARFLQRPDGRLPSPWRLKPQIATFLRGSTPVGFRVKRIQ